MSATDTLAVTGHRPDKLGVVARYRLPGFAAAMLRAHAPQRVITGMALGWDTAIAAACVQLGIPFTAALPCRGQERRWPFEDQQRYFELIAKADKVHYVCDGEDCDAAALELRNRWMVDNADRVLALWNGTPSGTANCVAYATGLKPLTNVWAMYLAYAPR